MIYWIHLTGAATNPWIRFEQDRNFDLESAVSNVSALILFEVYKAIT